MTEWYREYGITDTFFADDNVCIVNGDCQEVLSILPDKCINLTVTSPPYDNLRNYNGYSFDFEPIAKELYRVHKDGGVMVWVEKSSYKKWCDTMTDLEHALLLKSIGFSVRTMIYRKIGNQAFNWKTERFYPNGFEYMFVCAKGKPNTVNLLRDIPNKHAGKTKPDYTKKRTRDGVRQLSGKQMTVAEYGLRQTVWDYQIGYMKSSPDKDAYKHPAIFPEQLVQDHILSWSEDNDLILDPMLGSGTTLKVATNNKRRCIGIEISEEYCELATIRYLRSLSA